MINALDTRSTDYTLKSVGQASYLTSGNVALIYILDLVHKDSIPHRGFELTIVSANHYGILQVTENLKFNKQSFWNHTYNI